MVSIKVMANKSQNTVVCVFRLMITDINNKECDVHLYLLTYFLKQQEDAEIGGSAQPGSSKDHKGPVVSQSRSPCCQW